MSAAVDKSVLVKQVSASLFFGISSILIVMVNKLVLTTYKSVNVVASNINGWTVCFVYCRFPSFQVLGLGQVSCAHKHFKNFTVMCLVFLRLQQ